MVLDQENMKFVSVGDSHAAAAGTHCPTGVSQGPGSASRREVESLLSSSPRSLNISNSPSCSVR